MNNDTNINEQVVQIYDGVRTVTEQLTEIQATCNTANQKGSVIGKALVDQKTKVDDLVARCNAIQAQQQTYLNDTKAHQENTDKNMTGVLQISTQMGKVDERQQTLLESLASLRASQDKFVTYSQSHSEVVSDKLSGLNALLENVQKSVDELEVEDQVAFINAQVKQIATTIHEYKQAQATTHNAIVAQMHANDELVKRLSDDIRGQYQLVASIEQSAKTYKDKTMEMCETFNMLLTQYQAVEETKDISLEEMFIRDEPTPEPVPQKKKGLFSRMFGGK